MSFRTIVKYFGMAVAVAIVGFILIQFIPINTTNPPVVSEPNWDSPQTRALAQRACFDCHSNETVWPPYSKIAPVSWVVANHVSEGREKLNFSDWASVQPRKVNEAVEVILEGSMPPLYYTAMHPTAQLTPTEKQALADGLRATFENTSQVPANDTGQQASK